MTDNYSFNKFCELLDDSDILRKSTVIGVSYYFKDYIKDIKSQVLKHLVTLTENKNDYLEYLINEIERQAYIKDFDVKHVQKWLEQYDISIEEVLAYENRSSAIYAVIDRHYNDMQPFSNEKDKAFLVQSDFLNYFCCFYVDELIAFLESKKNKEIKELDSELNIPKPYKEIYLDEFCKSVSNERVILKTPFFRVYDFEILHFKEHLKTEIIENLSVLTESNKIGYIEYVIHRLGKTPYVNNEAIHLNYLDKWMKEYNTNIEEFPDFKNQKLIADLNKSYDEFHNSHQDQFFIEDIQIDFYCYACMLEVEKMIDFVKSKTETKKEGTVEAREKKIKQLTINQIVLLLQEIGLFTHPNIENATKVAQSKLISSITGLNEKNIKTAIEKLDKKANDLGWNYQKDIDKVNDILNNME